MDKLLENVIKSHEGKELRLYKCKKDKWSIGYGRNLEDVGISEAEAQFMLENDIHKASAALMRMPIVKNLNHNRRRVCVEMIFNLGVSGFLEFRKMIAAIERKDFENAAREILDSDAARDLPLRYHELSAAMHAG